MNKEFKKEHKEAFICICISLMAAVLVYIAGGSEKVLKNGYEIDKEGYGDQTKTYDLMVGSENIGKVPIKLEIDSKKYTENEANQKIIELIEELPLIMCNKNSSLESVSSDLYLPTKLDKYPGIKLKWYPDDLEIIAQDGKVNNKGIEESISTKINLYVSVGELKKHFIYDVIVHPAKLSMDEAFISELSKAIEIKKEEYKFGDKVELPREVNGKEVKYYEKADYSPVYIILLGFLGAGLILLKPKEEMKKEKKMRERELMLDYSDMVSKLLVYIGAGLTLRNAWLRIVQVYEEGVKEGRRRRCCYEEMSKAAERIKQGVPEVKAYREFAYSCGLRPYMRLCSLLEQNLKNGDKMLKSALELEMQDAFNDRKNIAKRLGEEMSTKLLLPLFISMAGVMMIVSVPALIRLG
ncbi:MAG: hypothetical protein Q4B86_00395 [Eubacteriales bacterium]|nr:hypothetical protein [Eubacteriales bacterium]